MRGTLTAVVVCHLVRGIIPAYAGNTIQLILCFPPCRDHPRVCGEHQVRDTLYGTTQGSSPRMRGTLGSAIQAPFMLGIIPAYAGNTNDRTPIYRMRRDHPRVCGEHRKRPEGQTAARGSSPRMRGTHASRMISARVKGIIPAYAGNTTDVLGGVRVDGDHPRVCGEHALMASKMPVNAGSSPRMRGTHGSGHR